MCIRDSLLLGQAKGGNVAVALLGHGPAGKLQLTLAAEMCIRDRNCTVGQGYYFDKPMPLEAFMAKYMTAQPN